MDAATITASVAARPTYAALGSNLIQAASEEALQVFADYTARTSVPDSALSVLVDIACIRLSMAGAEGSSSASEGGISRTWDSLPTSLRDRMDYYRRPRL